ncbi:MAG: efflux RND transporter periplasmic adaptor subunit [Acidiferrobacterales bacterium]|nr:efflux RND transporter periplasmic adaptor subunit [Acidiferrobacterales bacterium]
MKKSLTAFLTLVLALACEVGIADDNSKAEVVPPDSAHECLIEPAAEVALSSPVSGIISSIKVDRGNRVKRGQTLVRLQATAELAAIELAKAKLEFGERKVVRTQELFRENFTSEYSVDEAVTEAKLAEVELEQAQTILSQKTLRSPINGLVVERLAQAGEFVSDHEILKLAQLNPLHVEVVLPVELVGTVKRGMKAKVFPQKPIGGDYDAEVLTVDHVLDAASGTFGVRLALPNPKNKLPAGLRCLVDFIRS